MSLVIPRIIVSLLLATRLIGGVPEATQIKELHVYFLPWHILAKHDLGASDVRAMASTRWQILSTSSIKEALSALPISELAAGPGGSPDLRLVLDIYFKNGSRSSYFSDGEYLYSSDMKFRTKTSQSQINKALLERLEYLQ